jgi:predicted lipid-binding transport protein (Tim44 family)
MSTAEAWEAENALDQLQADDLNFDTDHFLEFAEMVFFLVKKAIQDRNPTGARAFVTDPVFQQLQAQAQALAARGVWLTLDGLYVVALSIEDVIHEPGWNYIAVGFIANAATLYIDASGNVVEGRREVQDFKERWTFARADTAKSKIGGGVMEFKCPSCASPLSVTEVGVCQHCGAGVASGALEWVVVRVDS